MSILTSLGQAVKTVESKLTGDTGKLTPVGLALYTDSATKFLVQLKASLSDPSVQKALNALCLNNPPPTGSFQMDRQSYDEMAHLLPLMYNRAARRDVGTFLLTGLSAIIPALEELTDKTAQVIPHGGIDVAGDMRLSTALVLSYVDQAINYGQWCAFMIDHALGLAEKDTLVIPKYTFTYLADHAPFIARFYQDAVGHNGISVVKNVLKMKGTPRDISVSDAQGVQANYLSDNTYSEWEQGMAAGVIRNPISMFYTMKENYRLNRIETLRNRTNWLKERMSLLSARNMNVDPKSAEYKKNHDAVQHYSNLVTDYDRKIMALS